MKRALTLMLVVAVVAATAITVGAATAAPAKKQDTNLSGAGSSFVFPLVSKWIPALGSAYGYNVSYYPIGSGGGIAAITAKTVDFGASDAPLSTDQASGMRGLCADSVGAFCHVDHVQPARHRTAPCALTGPILAKIYLGEITTWNDAAITKINPKCTLPSSKITPVHRSDNSGTTYNFTDYLSAVSPAWKSKLGVGVNAQWPAGPGASGSSGVAGVITQDRGCDRVRRCRLRAEEQDPLRVGAEQVRQVRDAGSARHQGRRRDAPEEPVGQRGVLDRGSAEGQPARLPDLDVHLRDRVRRARRSRRSSRR